MEGNLQQYLFFHLTGERSAGLLRSPISEFRPALLARYSDLTPLRYDFPLILVQSGSDERSICSLSSLIDDAVDGLTSEPERDRIARHGYEIEREIRRTLIFNTERDLKSTWAEAVTSLSKQDTVYIESGDRLWTSFNVQGVIIDVDVKTPSKVIRHIWSAVQLRRADKFRAKVERLLKNLHDILDAEVAGSAAGRSPVSLLAGVGTAFSHSFDFDSWSQILDRSKPAAELSDSRRNRIYKTIEVLEGQRFFPVTAGIEPYDLVFENCSDAVKAYRSRQNDLIELLGSIAVAQLEARGEYRESIHDDLFNGFGIRGLTTSEASELPDYLILLNADTIEPEEQIALDECLAAELPFKVLVQSDDLLSTSSDDDSTSLSLKTRQLVASTVGLNNVFVLQTAASNLARANDALVKGLSRPGPSLFSVYSGAAPTTSNFPPYLVAAAALESRAFPSLVFDPSSGGDWASRMTIDENPSPASDWPVHDLWYEDNELQAQRERVAFTLADFLVMDDRCQRHFAVTTENRLNEDLISIEESIKTHDNGLPSNVPVIALVDDGLHLRRAIADRTIVRLVARCREVWRSLQGLAGAHKPGIEGALDDEEASLNPKTATAAGVEAAAPSSNGSDPQETLSDTTEIKLGNGDPYIETARCTTCNECTQINNRMFAYNDNKQAYIADPDAGTFRQLVEAAEGCQVSIIHPGQPRNPNEPGLEDLICRAELFS